MVAVRIFARDVMDKKVASINNINVKVPQQGGLLWHFFNVGLVFRKMFYKLGLINTLNCCLPNEV